jgi:SAM-dependent methyltransferase
MSRADREQWDARYAAEGMAPVVEDPSPGRHLLPIHRLVPTNGHALDLACGTGENAVWLARRGMDVWGVDVSLVAVGLAQERAERSGVGERCRFDAFDLDDGLPKGPPVDLLLCSLFFDERLASAMIDRLAPAGTLIVVALSEVGHGPGDFRVQPGGLLDAFGSLEVLEFFEGSGVTRIVAGSPGEHGARWTVDDGGAD